MEALVVAERSGGNDDGLDPISLVVFIGPSSVDSVSVLMPLACSVIGSRSEPVQFDISLRKPSPLPAHRSQTSTYHQYPKYSENGEDVRSIAFDLTVGSASDVSIVTGTGWPTSINTPYSTWVHPDVLLLLLPLYLFVSTFDLALMVCHPDFRSMPRLKWRMMGKRCWVVRDVRYWSRGWGGEVDDLRCFGTC